MHSGKNDLKGTKTHFTLLNEYLTSFYTNNHISLAKPIHYKATNELIKERLE